MLRIFCVLFIFLSGVTSVHADDGAIIVHESLRPRSHKRVRLRPHSRVRDSILNSPRDCRHLGPLLKGGLRDIVDLHKNLFTWDTYTIIAGFFPLVLATRRVDKDLHRCFYDADHHKNISQVPNWCPEAMKISIAAPVVFLGLRGLFGQHETDEFRHTTRMLLLGFPFVIWAKELIKKAESDICYRPWNENFSCDKPTLGGFPSGHLAEATYIAALYGMRFGPAYAVPLGAMAWSIGVAFMVCNRHYLSQIVAGAGLGLLYAVSAQKVIDSRMLDCVDVGIGMQGPGRPTVSLTYRF